MGRVFIEYIDQGDTEMVDENAGTKKCQDKQKSEEQKKSEKKTKKKDEHDKVIYACKECKTHLAEGKDLMSKVSKASQYSASRSEKLRRD